MQTKTAARAGVASREIASSALLIALLAVSCMFTVPLGPVPFTLQTAVVILVALLCTPRQSALVVGAYLLMGVIGLPVFSGMTGGPGKLLGPTGGFLVGFLVGAVIASAARRALAQRTSRQLAADILAAALVISLSDILGLAWFMFATQSDAASAFLVSTAPFIIPDCCKAVLAIIVATAVRKGLHR